jgi:hypothetical protein
MAVTYTFSTQSGSIPLAQLDANFATPITIGNTSVQLGNTITTLNNITLANTTISSGNVTLTNVSITTANVTTANITNAVIGTANVTTANITSGVIATANITTGNVGTLTLTNALGTASGGTGLTSFTSGGVVYASSSSALSTGSALTFDGTNLGVGTSGQPDKLYVYANTSASGIFVRNDGAGPLQTWATFGTTKMLLDTSGNLLVGTTTNYNSAGFAKTVSLYDASSVNISLTNASKQYQIGITGTSLGIYDGTASAYRMYLDTSGNLLLGTTSFALSNSNNFMFGKASGETYTQHVSGTASGVPYSSFTYNATVIGSITQSGTTGVLYNITSDYRLKTVIGPVSNSGLRIDALEPVEYEWKSDGSLSRGFLAHQFQEVYPNSVTGEKDSVDEDGKPVYQNMQASTSEVIADLVSEIKSLRIRIAQLEAK